MTRIAVGDRFPCRSRAPAAGLYKCSEPGCNHYWSSDTRDRPLPPAHHRGAGWRLVRVISPALEESGDK